MAAPAGYVVTIGPDKRTLPQNSKMWAMLTDVSQQVKWPFIRWGGDWELVSMIPNDWKEIFTASLHNQNAAQGIDGGIVYLGHRTRDNDKKEMSDLLEVIQAFGNEKGIRFNDLSE